MSPKLLCKGIDCLELAISVGIESQEHWHSQ